MGLHYILIFYILQSNNLNYTEFDTYQTCMDAGKVLTEEFADKDDNGVILQTEDGKDSLNSLFHCVKK